MGGDARYLEVIHKLSSEGATIFLAGYDQLTFKSSNVINTKLSAIDFSVIDAITLPVAGTNDSGETESIYSDTDIVFTEDIIASTPENCIIYTGISNTYLESLAASYNRDLVTLFARDDLAIYNSIPTAEGTLMLALEQTDFTIHGSSVLVLGFGRVGKTVTRLFSSVGAKVSVGVRKSADIARITEMGLTPVHLENLEQEIASAEICINTIPHPIIDTKVISAMARSALIIDITSAPGGTDFAFADKLGIKALHALGLPGKTAPKSAGRIIGSVLLGLLVDKKDQ